MFVVPPVTANAEGDNMYKLLGLTHNQIDGAFCFGLLTMVRWEMGARGMICIYRCQHCDAEIRNVE